MQTSLVFLLDCGSRSNIFLYVFSVIVNTRLVGNFYKYYLRVSFIDVDIYVKIVVLLSSFSPIMKILHSICSYYKNISVL